MRTMTLKRFTAGVLSVALLSACEVTNPGPVQDEFLAEPASQQGLINGAIRRMNELIGNGAYTLALTAREVFPGGQTGAQGHDVVTQGGTIQEGSFGGYFNDAQQARFIAETAIKRFSVVDAPDDMMYQAHLWAGYAYRYLGDWWCDAVIGSTDPDDPEPGSFESGTDTYYTRAITNFTTALTFAATDAQRYAARAGRAQAYLALGQWANAAADAAVVPNNFVFAMNMDDLEQATYNQIFWAVATTPYIAISMVNTFFEDHYDATGDQRIRYESVPGFTYANASLSGYGQVPFTRPTKYDDRADDMNIATGWEMRLLQAETIIRQTPANHLDALALINQVHTRILSDLTNPASPLPALTSTSVAETASHLTRERYLELFLEGKRAPDERRWARFPLPAGTNIDVPNWSPLSTIFVPVNQRGLCYDIPTAERDANPNVPPS